MSQLPQTAETTEALPGPRPGQLIRVHGCNQRRVTAQVVHIAPRSIQLRLMQGDADTVRELVEAQTVAAEFISAGTMHRLFGRVHLYTGADGTSLFLIPRGGTQVLGRRKHLRTELEAVVVLQNRATDERIEGWAVNVSVGGMLVDRLSSPVVEDRIYGFSIVPSGAAESITGTARVVRLESDKRAALKVQVLSHPSVDELARFLFEEADMRRSAR